MTVTFVNAVNFDSKPRVWSAVPDDVNGVSAAFLSCRKWVFANAVVVARVGAFFCACRGATFLAAVDV